jgi:NADH-quinone oxidoreductase subunit L
MLEYAWLIAVLPLLSFVINVARKTREPVPGYIGSVLLGVVWLWSIAIAAASIADPGLGHAATFEWLPGVRFGFQIDHLTTLMLIVVTSVSFFVHVYSIGYMHGDEHFNVFYAYLGLFSSAMLALVMADGFLPLLISWELVGVSSYLLIGFWYHKPEAMRAAKKAFVVTRFGDLGMLLGVVVLWNTFGTLNYAELWPKLNPADAALVAAAGAAAMLLFFGAVGKSAQFPLHVWLPDAMEGPTPVSALIHAATMVAAGVYLVGRAFPLFEYGSLHTFNWLGVGVTPLGLVRWLGVLTALLGATVAVAQNDIKRVLAYSTVSQLGYMMVAIGLAGWIAGLFHLFTHAFFKALLFLGSGSVIHGTGTQDMREMGGVRKHMPATFWTYVVGYLALAGVPVFAGFWSKDAILDQAWITGMPGYFWALIVGAFCTAFYMTRQMVMVFGGDRPRNPAIHVHESPFSMTVPLVALAVAAVLAGFIGVPSNNRVKEYLAGVEKPFLAAVAEPVGHGGHEAAALPTWLEGAALNAPAVDRTLEKARGPEHEAATIPGTGLNLVVTLIGTCAAALGLLLGYLVYKPASGRSVAVAETYARKHGLSADAHAADHAHGHSGPAVDPQGFWAEPLAKMPGYRLLVNKYYFDEILWALLVVPTMAIGRASFAFDKWVVDMIVNGVGMLGLLVGQIIRFVDNYIVDGIVNATAGITQGLGRGLRLVQTGRVQNYAVVLFLGALALAAAGLMGLAQ